MRGKENVASRTGLIASFFIVALVLYFALIRLVQYFVGGRIQTRDNLAYGEAVGKKVDITDQMANLAFRAMLF